MKTQTLICRAGDHVWERPSQLGKRPHNCPEHKPTENVVKTKPTEIVVMSEPTETDVEAAESESETPEVVTVILPTLSGKERAARLVENMKSLHKRERVLIVR